uniref:Uncharacterized protein n=1 Tax=Seriola dumerili TaxID=41447 RepID=A0A3B4TWK6_SERDU
MTIIFLWLLPLTTSSVGTSGQNHVMTGEVTGSMFTQGHLTAQEASSLHPVSEVSGHNIRPSFAAGTNPSEEKTTTPSGKLPTISSNTFSPVNQTAATPTSSILSLLNSSIVGAKQPTTTTRVPPILSSSTQSPDTGSDRMTPASTQLILTVTTSAKPAVKSTSTSPVTGGDATHPTGSYKTSLKRQDPPKEKPNRGVSHGKAVAWIIGGALVLMMVGFLVIFIKKRKLQKQQITTTDWAGPSPFLEDGADNGFVTPRSSNRISLSSFLPQRLSKRLSLLPETEEELDDMTPGTTFGEKRQGNTSGQQVDGRTVPESNGTAADVPGMKSTGDVPETVETSPQNCFLLSTENNSENATAQQNDAGTNSLSHFRPGPELTGASDGLCSDSSAHVPEAVLFSTNTDVEHDLSSELLNLC